MTAGMVQENGDIDHAHTRKKNRLHNDLDKAIDILSRQRSKLSSIEAKYAALTTHVVHTASCEVFAAVVFAYGVLQGEGVGGSAASH